MLNPAVELEASFKEACLRGDATARVGFLATVDEAGSPRSRAMAIKGVSPRGVRMVTSTTSPKWNELQNAPYELLLFWPSLGQQFRVRGSLERVTDAELTTEWEARDAGARALDLLHEQLPQSSLLTSRDELLARLEEIRSDPTRIDSDAPPDHLIGFELVPQAIEIWRRDPQSAHHRTLHVLTSGSWSSQVVVP